MVTYPQKCCKAPKLPGQKNIEHGKLKLWILKSLKLVLLHIYCQLVHVMVFAPFDTILMSFILVGMPYSHQMLTFNVNFLYSFEFNFHKYAQSFSSIMRMLFCVYFRYTGATCDIDINECASNPCEHGGTCTDYPNMFRCACPPGTQGIRYESYS